MTQRRDLEAIHRFSSGHRAEIEASTQCGCFYCGAMIPPGEIADWVDATEARHGEEELDSGVTALCPRCGIDAVLPDARVSITRDLLSEMRAYWFDRSTRL